MLDTIHFKCSECGHEFQQSFSGLNATTSTTCPACGHVAEHNPESMKIAQEETSKTLGELGKDIKEIVKNSPHFKLK